LIKPWIVERNKTTPRTEAVKIIAQIEIVLKMRLISILLSTPEFWAFLLINSIGGSAVAIGLWGEGWAEKRKFQEVPGDLVPHISEGIRRRKCKRFFERLLLGGVVFEVIAAVVTTVYSSIEVARSQERTANVERESEVLRSNNLLLRSHLAVLELKVQPRTIAPEQKRMVVELLKNCPKGPVTVGASGSDTEAFLFMMQIADVLTESGFKVEKDLPLVGGPIAVGVYYEVQNNNPAPDHAQAISAAFAKAGFQISEVRTNSGLPKGHFVIWVGSKLFQ
jgi:hypothetical protein